MEESQNIVDGIPMRINKRVVLIAALPASMLLSFNVPAEELSNVTCAELAQWVAILPPKPKPLKELDAELKEVFSETNTKERFGLAFSQWDYQNMSTVRKKASECRQTSLQVNNKGFSEKLSKVVLYIITQPVFRAGPTK